MHRKHEKLAHMQILIRIRLFSIPYAGGFSLVFPALMHHAISASTQCAVSSCGNRSARFTELQTHEVAGYTILRTY